MVRSRRQVTVYVEGGARGNDFLQSTCRKGFQKFAEAAGIYGVSFSSWGGRNQAHGAFCSALENRKQDSVVLLLIDSEDPIEADTKKWTHLESRKDNELQRPNNATEEHVFLMVQCMETWLIADVESLKRQLGHGFSTTPFKHWPKLEDVAKTAVLEALSKATHECKNRYAKGAVSFELLGNTSPAKVAAACLHANEFIDRLRKHSQPL
jgi:hypothetical protein